MTRFALPTLVALVTALSHLSICQAGFGAYLDILANQQSGPYITYAVTTLEVPSPPSPQVQILVLWPGLYTNNDLIQSIVASFEDPSKPSGTFQGCNGKPGQWCAFASELRNGAEQNNVSTYVAVDPGDMLTIEYKQYSQNNSWVQTISKDGQAISQLVSTNTQNAYRWGPYVECQDEAQGRIAPAHKYFNSKLVLDRPDLDYASSLATNGAENDGFTTPDNGQTWEINTIQLEETECPS